MLRTKTDWTRHIFAVVLYVGWHQMAEAEYVYIRVLINNTSSQAKDAFCSSTATGWFHCIFPAINLVTFWSLTESTASSPLVHHSALAYSLEQGYYLQWSELLSLSCQLDAVLLEVIVGKRQERNNSGRGRNRYEPVNNNPR